MNYDAIIIGTGQAGPPLAGRLSESGWKVAIIERKLFGGTCVNTGCIPTKALVASARAAHMARRGDDFGVRIGGDVSVDMKKVKQRKDEISGSSNKGVEKWLRGLDNVSVLEGHARFVGPHEVVVGEQHLSAEKIFINVGGRAFIPDGFNDVPLLTNTSMMAVDFVPEHLIVVGGSYIGLEFAQMYRRFGSRVSVVERSARLVSREDEDTSLAIQEILEAEGVDVHLGAQCIGAEPQGQAIRVRLDCEGDSRELIGSHLLLAVGRRPNTHELGLESAGVEIDQRGYVRVDDQLRTNVEGIWAMGDCNGKGAFTHTAYNDFEIVAANLLDDDPRRVSDRIVTYGLFVDPPLARVGLTEAQVRASGRPALIGKRPMKHVGRAREKSETFGFMKVLVDAKTEHILGAAILGVGGDEAIHCITDLMYAEASYRVMQRAVHIHPTVAELLPTVLGSLGPLE